MVRSKSKSNELIPSARHWQQNQVPARPKTSAPPFPLHKRPRSGKTTVRRGSCASTWLYWRATCNGTGDSHTGYSDSSRGYRRHQNQQEQGCTPRHHVREQQQPRHDMALNAPGSLSLPLQWARIRVTSHSWPEKLWPEKRWSDGSALLAQKDGGYKTEQPHKGTAARCAHSGFHTSIHPGGREHEPITESPSSLQNVPGGGAGGHRKRCAGLSHARVKRWKVKFLK